MNRPRSPMLRTQRVAGLDTAEPLHSRGAGSREQSPGGGLCSHGTDQNGTTAAIMRIRTDTAASAVSLTDYIRRCECIVEVIDRRVIDATAGPQSFAAPHADLELEGYLTVWQAMHPESLVERLTPRRPSEPGGRNFR